MVTDIQIAVGVALFIFLTFLIMRERFQQRGERFAHPQEENSYWSRRGEIQAEHDSTGYRPQRQPQGRPSNPFFGGNSRDSLDDYTARANKIIRGR